MTVEDLAKRHLDVDLRKPDFWLQSFKIFEAKVQAFERAVGAQTRN
jgi:oligoendopeptidase F